MSPPRLNEVFLLKEDQKVEFRQLTPSQREALELSVHADVQARGFDTDIYEIVKGSDGKLRAKLSQSQSDPRVWAAANDGVLPVNLVWDKSATNQETGDKGDWVPEK